MKNNLKTSYLLKLSFILLLNFLIQDLNASLKVNHSDFYAIYEFTPVTGFLQIPTAGRIESTTPKRPTLEELNIKQFGKEQPFFKMGFSTEWLMFGLYGEYEYNHTYQNAVLKEDLQTHYYFISAGSTVTSKIFFDTYRFGFYRRIMAEKVILKPGIELNLLDFKYELAEPICVARNFRPATVRLSIVLDYPFSDDLHLIVNAASSIPSTTNLDSQSVTGDVVYTVHTYNTTRNTTRYDLLFGVGYQRLELKDGQEMPNYILFKMTPILRAGFKIGFC